MRRSEKEITDPAELDEVLQAARTLVLGICGAAEPYLVPLSYGWAGRTIYLHCAPAGRKLELLAANPRVSFAAVEEPVIVSAAEACGWSARARSVVGTGTVRRVEDEAERTRGLAAVMRHYSPGEWSLSPAVLARTVVLALDVDAMTGKRTG
jgi:uncharacterized protein